MGATVRVGDLVEYVGEIPVYRGRSCEVLNIEFGGTDLGHSVLIRVAGVAEPVWVPADDLAVVDTIQDVVAQQDLADMAALGEWEDQLVFEQKVKELFAANQELLLSKHRDYGPKNISQSPGGPLNGLRVRMWDKTARINNLIDSGADPEHEGLRDSFIDLANYALIAALVLDGNWPDE